MDEEINDAHRQTCAAGNSYVKDLLLNIAKQCCESTYQVERDQSKSRFEAIANSFDRYSLPGLSERRHRTVTS